MTRENILYDNSQTIAENHIDGYLYGAELKGSGGKEWKSAPGKIEHNAIVLVKRGRMTYTMNREEFTVKSHEMKGIPNWATIEEIRYSDDFHGCIIEACDEILMDIFRNNNPLPLDSMFRLSGNNNALSLSRKECSTLFTDIRNIISALGEKQHHFLNELNYAYLYIFTADLASIIWDRHGNGIPDHTLEISRSGIIFQQFLELLGNNIESAHRISFYAEKLCISKQYLSLIVREMTGNTIGKVISKVRAEKALRLLTRTDLSIKQIADRLSFPDQSTFGKFFKRQFGKSPVEYRGNITKKLRV